MGNKEAEKMKTPPSVFRISLATITVAAACIGTPWGAVNVQSMATNNASATLAFPSTQANPTATLPATPLLATSVVQVRALTYGVGEVVKLHQAGIDKDIIVNYINNSDLPYNLTADGILYLQSLGVPKEITTASSAESIAGNHATPRWSHWGATTSAGDHSNDIRACRHDDGFGLSGL
jgi:hypothetical protein